MPGIIGDPTPVSLNWLYLRRVACWVLKHKWNSVTFSEFVYNRRTFTTQQLEYTYVECERCHKLG
jgi:hypothetical protein